MKTNGKETATRCAERRSAGMMSAGLRRAVLLLMTLAGLSSCLKDDDTEVVYYDDTAVTAFTLGTVKRTLHTTSSTGEDSTYMASVTGSRYAFSIDQQQGLIYNVDSLPAGCDVTRVLATISTKNSGTVVLNLKTADGEKDSLVLFSNTDSIDFSKPLELRAFNHAATAYRRYTVDVRVHQQESDTFVWTAMTLDDAEKDQLLDRLAASPSTIGELLGDDAIDADAEWLPERELNIVEQTLKTNPGYVRRVLVGNRSIEDYPDDATAVVWSRVVAPDASGVKQPWLFYVPADDNRYLLPRLANLQVVAYDDRLLAIGGAGLGACTAEAYTCFYESEDGGITWRESTVYTLPGGVAEASVCAMVVDEDGYLWLVADGGRQIWRGRS